MSLGQYHLDTVPAINSFLIISFNQVSTCLMTFGSCCLVSAMGPCFHRHWISGLVSHGSPGAFRYRPVQS